VTIARTVDLRGNLFVIRGYKINLVTRLTKFAPSRIVVALKGEKCCAEPVFHTYISEIVRPNFFYACCLWLWLDLWRCCNTLCSSGFVDDVLFIFIMGPMATWRYRSNFACANIFIIIDNLYSPRKKITPKQQILVKTQTYKCKK